MNLSNFTNEVEKILDMYGTGCTLQSVVTACILIEVRPDMDAVPPDTPHELVHVILGVPVWDQKNKHIRYICFL